MTDLPNGWRRGNIRRFASMKTGHTPSRSVPEYWLDPAILWFTLADVWQLRGGRQVYVDDTTEKISELGLQQSAAELLPAGTVVLSRTASVGFSGIMRVPMATSQDFWNWVCGPELLPEYLNYQFKALAPELRSLNMGSTHQTIYQKDAAGVALIVPPIDEQKVITGFLDLELTKIDAVIAKQEQLIATLREDRIATITHVVTKGLDADATMNDSGVRGLGTIPESWSVRPFLRCVQSRVDYRGATPKKVDDGVLLVTARNVRPGWIDYEVSEEYVSAEDYGEIMRRGLPVIDDLLLTMEAPLGNAALVDRTDIALAQRIIKFRPDTDVVLPKFLLYAVMGQWFQYQLITRATGSTALGLKASKLPELRVVVPDINEQKRIICFLDERWANINKLVMKSTEVIDRLREYRSALITDAVTGKIDVRRVV